MKKFLSGLCATTLALSFAAASVVPASAMQPFMPKIEAAPSSVIKVQLRDQYDQRFLPRYQRRDMRDARDFRRDGRDVRRMRDGIERRGDSYYWRGHRGYRNYRRGYREYNGFWFPSAAFIAGAIVGGALNNSQPVYRGGGNAHVQWCYDRYRSYRASDNTYQPYNGPRRQCQSPYG